MKQSPALVVTVLLTITLPAMVRAQRTQGVDVSQFQGNMQWETTYDAGARFAFVRATRGGTAANPTWGSASFDDTAFSNNVLGLRNLALSQNKIIYNGFYHYSRPDMIAVNDGNNSSIGGNRTNSQPALATILANATDEANHFFSVVGSHYLPTSEDLGRRLRPVLDVEEGGGTDGADPGADAFTASNLTLWVDTFLDTFESLSGGVRPLVYMNTNYATNRVTTALSDEDLWLARYNSSPVDPQTSNPETPSGFPNPYGAWNVPYTGFVPSHDVWSFWQYSADGNGMGSTFGAESSAIDLDLANGDINFVRSFLIPEPGGATLALGMAFAAIARRRRCRRR